QRSNPSAAFQPTIEPLPRQVFAPRAKQGRSDCRLALWRRGHPFRDIESRREQNPADGGAVRVGEELTVLRAEESPQRAERRLGPKRRIHFERERIIKNEIGLRRRWIFFQEVSGPE